VESSEAKGHGDRKTLVILAALTAAVGVAAMLLTRSINPLRGDSAEYLYFDPSRTVGYPAFLAFVRLLTGKVEIAVPVQTALLAGSLLFLGWSFHRLVRLRSLSTGVQLLLVGNPGMWLTSAFLMTEALSTALVALWTALLLRTIDDRRASRLVGLVAVSSIATMIRPSLVALVGATALIVLTASRPPRVRGWLALTAAGLATAWAATPIAQFVVHGSAHTTSPLARGVLQHSLYCALDTAPASPDSAFVEEDVRPVRQYIERAPAEIREQLRREYSTPLRFGSIIPVLGRRHGLATRSQADPYLAAIARERIGANPSCYARAVLNEYLRLAAFDTDPTAANARDVNAFVQSHPPPEVAQYPLLPGDDRMARRAAFEVGRSPAGFNPARAGIHVIGDVPLLALMPFRLLYVAAALAGAVALVALAFRRPINGMTLPVLAAMGLALHGMLAITAFVEIGFYRYLVPCWPLVCSMVMLAVLMIMRGVAPTSAAVTSLTLDGPAQQPKSLP
jgi:hypothetical protein